MNRALVDRIADAVLYEGYILYPYRPSLKNRQRWTFGGLFPETYCREWRGGDASSNQTECLVHGTPATSIEARIRFLHLSNRGVGALTPPLAEWPEGAEPCFRPVETLRVGNTLFQPWQEAEEREVVIEATSLGELLARPRSHAFTFPGGRRLEPLREGDGKVVGVLVRERQPLAGDIDVAAVEAGPGLYRVTLRVINRTPMETDPTRAGEGADAGRACRDAALLRSLVSSHTILDACHGEFVSLMDPPDAWREAAAACRNIGTWPVLVGEEGERQTMLSSPIILYDYPQIAPESPGDFFDGTEIDEMLTLRIMTLTDEEKFAMTAVDDRAGALLARTEAMARAQLRGLHGTFREPGAPPGEGTHG